MAKISIIGAGSVGATTAHWLLIKEHRNIVLFDIVDGLPQGKALDLTQCCAVEGYHGYVKGTSSYEDTKDSDVVVISAGFPRKPGMSRDDLVSINTKIVKDVTEHVAAYSPHAILIVVTNPLDAMVHVVKKVSNFPNERVMGMAGVLDTARFKTLIAQEVGCSTRDINALVLGGHGDSMVPLISHTNIGGVPLASLTSKAKIDQMIERTRKGGEEIVTLLKTSSTAYGPGAAIAEMIDAIINDKKRLMPVSAYLNGQYGVHDLFIGVPVILGRKGVERILEIELSAEEKAMFAKTVEHVKQLVAAVHL